MNKYMKNRTNKKIYNKNSKTLNKYRLNKISHKTIE